MVGVIVMGANATAGDWCRSTKDTTTFGEGGTLKNISNRLKFIWELNFELNSQAPELYRGPRALCARSGEKGEDGVISL